MKSRTAESLIPRAVPDTLLCGDKLDTVAVKVKDLIRSFALLKRPFCELIQEGMIPRPAK